MTFGRCERRKDSGVTCIRGTRGCYVDHEAYERGIELMSVKGYVPCPGMINMDDDRIAMVFRGNVHFVEPSQSIPVHEFVPNLKSGANRGLLLDQLREASGHADLSVVHHGQDSGEFHCALEVPLDNERLQLVSAVGRDPLDAEIAVLIKGAQTYFRE